MVDRTASFWISVVSVRIRYISAIKLRVCFMSDNGYSFNFLDLIGTFFEQNRAYNLRWTIVSRRSSII